MRWKADKVVNGKRLTMGEMDVSYDAWRSVLGRRVQRATAPVRGGVLVVEGRPSDRDGRHLPGKETVRRSTCGR